MQKNFRLGLGLQKGTVSLFGAKIFYWPIKLILTSKRHWWKKILDWGWGCEKGQCPFLCKKKLLANSANFDLKTMLAQKVLSLGLGLQKGTVSLFA